MNGKEKATPLLEIRGLKKYFSVRRGLSGSAGVVKAVDGVDLTVYRGETLGLVGESGCGKTTLGRIVVRLDAPTQGEVLFEGRNIGALSGRDLKEFRKQSQIIFQDPYSSLNPRKSAGTMIGEPLEIHRICGRKEREARVAEIMEKVGLTREQMNRYPHEFSGGQRQRIGIARAVVLGPKLIVADEPVSALDVSIQAQILNLLIDLQQDYDLTYLFISHDLGVVRHMSDRIAVMYLGRIVETAGNETLFEQPLHPYTAMLLDAIPSISRRRSRRRAVSGEAAVGPEEAGCTFYRRCPERTDICRKTVPELVDCGGGHLVSCHRRSAAAI